MHMQPGREWDTYLKTVTKKCKKVGFNDTRKRDRILRKSHVQVLLGTLEILKTRNENYYRENPRTPKKKKPP